MNKPARGQPPAVALIDPKYPHNVGAALRACSCWGVGQLWWTGDRVTLDVPSLSGMGFFEGITASA
jgi:tRNA C32,U32 (ribose-2'-O)-methylase TrmJ